MRIGPAAAAIVLGIALGATTASGQPAPRTPDLAQITLGPADLDGWTQTLAARDEVWGAADGAAAPNAPSEVTSFETQFTREVAGGSAQTLSTQAIQGRADLSNAYFAALRHDALGQTPVALPGLSIGWWEHVGDMRNATAAEKIGDMILQVNVSGVSDANAIQDSDLASWLGTMAQRATTLPDAGPTDWTQLLPSQPAPWSVLLDSSATGGDWDQQDGLELSSREDGGTVQSVTAARHFTHTGVYVRSLLSSATVYRSDSDAMSLGMAGSGTPIDAPALGDQATAFRATDRGDAADAPEVTYTINVRRGALVMTTRETGVMYSLGSPAEAIAFATVVDQAAANLVTRE